jgi:hypothetical protein
MTNKIKKKDHRLRIFFETDEQMNSYFIFLASIPELA